MAILSTLKKIWGNKNPRNFYSHTCRRCGLKYRVKRGINICPRCKTPFRL